MKIALFASHRPGIEIADFLSNRSKSDEIVALYLTGKDPQIEQEILSKASIPEIRVFRGRQPLRDDSHIEWLKDQNVDAIICVYWPWLLDERMFRLANITVNFHPAYLPVNRGWYPHVHSIMDGSKAGVTLHALSKDPDAGDIWAQREIKVLSTDCAGDLYDRLQLEIVKLFEESWSDIKCGRITPTPQDSKQSTYHSKTSLDQLDLVDLSKKFTGRFFVDLLRARTFGSRSFAYFEENGERIYINIRLSKKEKFD